MSTKLHKRGKRNSIKCQEQTFCTIGVNATGIKSKWTTFKKLVNKINPLIWNIQETKCKNEGMLKLNGFKVFEHVRNNQDGGGGLAIGCSTRTNPVLTRHGEDEVEALTVKIKLKKITISCTTAYGPQNNDLVQKKDNFWQYHNEEAKTADNSGEGYILQCDLNSWLGNDIIPNDPRYQNSNGKRFHSFLNDLTVVNSLTLCEGLITRKIIREGKVQKSVIVVDDEKKDILKNYTGSKIKKESCRL